MVPQDRDHQDTVDSTGMYRPITPLIRGNYDEYGGMEYIQNLDSVQHVPIGQPGLESGFCFIQPGHGSLHEFRGDGILELGGPEGQHGHVGP